MQNPILIGDPSLGGFGGVLVSDSNNDFPYHKSPKAWNFLIGEKGLEKRGGCLKDNAVEIGPGNVGVTGLTRFFDGTNQKTLVKDGTRVYIQAATGQSNFLIAEIAEAGDAANQLASWVLTGGNNGNTNAGVLYWKLADTAGTRTVELYKNSDGEAANLVASGSRAGDGAITLTAQNSSGLSGSVTVAYTIDDADLANNTLTYGVLTDTSEIEFESWLSNGLFFEGIDLYSFTTGMASKVSLLDQNGDALTGEKPKGRVIFKHNERLVLIGDRSRVYMSQTDYFNRYRVYDSDVTLLRCFQVCDKDDGNDCTGGCSYKGMIVAFKPNKMFLITGDMAFDNMQVVRHAEVGLYDQKSLVKCDDDFLRWYGGPDGKVYQFNPSTGIEIISNDIQPELDEIDPDLRHLVAGGWYKGKYLLAYPYGEGVTYNNRIIAFDTKRNEWVPIYGWNIARFAKFDDTNTLRGGWSDSGFVQNLFTGSSDNGSDIEAYYETKSHVGDDESYLDTLKARVQTDSGLTIGWITDITTGSISTIVAGLGDKLADENESVQTGFMLSDEEDTPETGSVLTDENEWNAALAKFNPRLGPGIRGTEFKFYFYEKSTDPCQIDYLKAYHTPVREG
jgi:hypothetical protein